MHEKICLYSTPFSNVTSYLQMVDIAAKYQIQNIETINGWELAKPDLEFARKLRSYADTCRERSSLLETRSRADGTCRRAAGR